MRIYVKLTKWQMKKLEPMEKRLRQRGHGYVIAQVALANGLSAISRGEMEVTLLNDRCGAELHDIIERSRV